jgi:ankyrin repeat protein
MSETNDITADFIQAACVPLNASHSSGTLERAETILAAHPEISTLNIYTAAILGDDSAVRRFVELDAANATQSGGPRNWDPLTYLCFSKYLRLDRARSAGFTRAATVLLDAGANANTGFYSGDEFETVLYGAAGVAHNAELTRLLVERGADPNDGEVYYHTPETWENGALQVLVESGKLTADSLAAMLLRKADWHDYPGIKYLLEHGADINRMTLWGYTALHQAIRRDNRINHIKLMLDHGADPALLAAGGQSAVVMAARRGRGDILELFEQRGVPVELSGVERLIAACARNDAAAVHSIATDEPELINDVIAQGGKLLAEFAGNDNADGVRLLLDLGVAVTALYEGDGYFGLAPNSLALHVAAWRARHATVKLLIERGSPVSVPDGRGRTPLALAARACVDSYWTDLRSPESVAALLAAGASSGEVEYPTGYDEVDALLRSPN